MNLAGKPWFRLAVAAVLAACIILTALGYTDRLLGWCGLNRLSASNSAYLKDSFDKSVKGFLVISTVKTGVAVITGSSVGVGFKIGRAHV